VGGVQIKKDNSAASVCSFLDALRKAWPIKMNRLLTDNENEFTDRLFASRESQPVGNNVFDVLCQDVRIKHNSTPRCSKQTNGMVERLNGRIGAVLQIHRLNSTLEINQPLLRYLEHNNHQQAQSALQSRTPIQAMKHW